MSTTTLRGPYAKTASVRDRILDACIDAFGESGFHGATMKDIARRADISYTGLLHHFPRKEELLIALLDARADRDQQYLEKTGALDTASNPLGVFAGLLDVIAKNELRPGLLELHCVLSGEATSPEHPAHAHYVEHYRNLHSFYASAFASLRDRGLLESDIAAETLATMTISLQNGLQAQWLFDKENVHMERTLQDFLGTFVPSLLDL